MAFDTIDALEEHLNTLTKCALQQICRNVGVARFHTMRMDQLRAAILAIAKGEAAPLPMYKRRIYQPLLLYHQDVVDAVAAFSIANLKDCGQQNAAKED